MNTPDDTQIVKWLLSGAIAKNLVKKLVYEVLPYGEVDG